MRRMAKPSPPRSKRTKVTLDQELKALEVSLDRERAEETAKASQVVAEEERATREAVQEITVETVAQRVAALGVELTRTLSSLTERFTVEVKLLEDVRKAVALEQQELERLHGRDVVASSTQELLEDYRRRKAALEAELKARQDEWQVQQDLRARQLREQEEEIKRQRQREKEEYEYQKALERKKDQDRYEEEKRQRERDWAARESQLREREQELATLKAEAAKIPAMLQTEVAKAVSDAVKGEQDRAKQQMLMVQKDRESDKQVSALRIAALEETVARQSAQIEALQNRLEDARAQVREIAVQAIEGASGARALAHINQIAMEQAKHRAPGG
jgi:hypothetical protein